MKKLLIFFGIVLLMSCTVKKEEIKKASLTNMKISEIASMIEIEIVDLEGLDSINILVNKKNDLPADYEPSDLIHPDVSTTKNLLSYIEQLENLCNKYEKYRVEI